MTDTRITTAHAGYGRYDVMFCGVVAGRAFEQPGGWRFVGWNNGVEISIWGRDSIEQVTELAVLMLLAGGLIDRDEG